MLGFFLNQLTKVMTMKPEDTSFFLWSDGAPKLPVGTVLLLRLYDRWRESVNNGIEYVDAVFDGASFVCSNGRKVPNQFVTGWVPSSAAT